MLTREKTLEHLQEEETNRMVIKRFIKALKGSEKRAFPRIEYPPAQRPRFKVGENEMAVTNISVSGLSFLHDKQTPIKIGTWISGKIVFLNGKSIDMTGQVIWKTSGEVGLLFSGRIAYPIIEEQMSIHKTENT